MVKKNFVCINISDSNNGVTISYDCQQYDNYMLTSEQAIELIKLNDKLLSEVVEARKIYKKIVSKCVAEQKHNPAYDSTHNYNTKIDPAIRTLLITISTARITLYKRLLEIIPKPIMPKSMLIQTKILIEENEIKELHNIPLGRLFESPELDNNNQIPESYH